MCSTEEKTFWERAADHLSVGQLGTLSCTLEEAIDSFKDTCEAWTRVAEKIEKAIDKDQEGSS